MGVSDPKKPGRGAWTAIGGLLPPKPGQVGRGYYYRPSYPGENSVGSAGLSIGATYNDLVVTEAVRAIQRLILAVAEKNSLDTAFLTVTGRFGDQTGAVTAAVQSHYGLSRDCIVGPKTVWELVKPIMEEMTHKYDLESWMLRGLARTESQLDLGAVGKDTPNDTGLMQINRGAHDVTIRQAVEPRWCVEWSADALQQRVKEFSAQKRVSPYVLAVAAHNSPRQARAWALAGEPPSQQIADYVTSTQEAGK